MLTSMRMAVMVLMMSMTGMIVMMKLRECLSFCSENYCIKLPQVL